MAERYVRGYAVPHQGLSSLVGTRKLTGAECLARVDPDIVEEVSMTLDLDEGELRELLDEIFGGQLDRECAYEYLRMLELVLAARGFALDGEIDVVMTYYLPNDSFGRWNPVLRELGLTRLAALWAEPNLPFPWEKPSGVDWPAVTGLAPDELNRLGAELGGDWRAALKALDPLKLVEPGRDADLPDVRDELTRGLERLADWVVAACSRRTGLVLWMDGDQ